MTTDYLELLREIFVDTDSLNMDQVKRLLVGTNAYFASLENTLQTGDAKAREQVIAAALDLKAFLDSKTNQSTQFLSLEALSEEEREMVEKMNKGLSLEKKGKSQAKTKKLKPIKLS